MASVLYVANTTSQLVPVGGTINLGSIIRRSCNSQANLAGNGITLGGTGYFVVNVSTTATGTAPGELTVELYKDGVAVPGATATSTITTATTQYSSVAFTAEVRNGCCSNFSTLTLVNNSTVPITFENVAVRVKRDA